MRVNTLAVLLLATGIFPFSVCAKSASDVFEQVSKSIVVIYAPNAEDGTVGYGSGVVLPTGDIATNCHVLEDANEFLVTHEGKDHLGIIRHSNPERDVCVITAYGLKAPGVRLGSTRTLKVGARVYAVGAPKGLELSLSEGIISSLREIKGGRHIQTTAPISPGSSGGGLFDENGNLIGLPTFFVKDGQQLNFAVPVEWIGDLFGKSSSIANSSPPNSLSSTNRPPHRPPQDVSYIVQLAALKDVGRANELKKRASNAGLPVYVDSEGDLTRVRVGPFSTRQDAVKAAVRLAEFGLAGQIIEQ